MTGVAAGTSAIPLAAVIPWAIAGAWCDLGSVDIREEWFLGKSLRFCDVEALYFAKIISPVGETSFDAI